MCCSVMLIVDVCAYPQNLSTHNYNLINIEKLFIDLIMIVQHGTFSSFRVRMKNHDWKIYIFIYFSYKNCIELQKYIPFFIIIPLVMEGILCKLLI